MGANPIVLGANTLVFGEIHSGIRGKYSGATKIIYGEYICIWENTVMFGGNTLVFWTDTVVFGASMVVFLTNTVVFRANTLIFRANTVLMERANFTNSKYGNNQNSNSLEVSQY